SGRTAPARGRRANRARRRLRTDRLPLRAGQSRRDPRSARRADPRAITRWAPASDALLAGSLSGLLLPRARRDIARCGRVGRADPRWRTTMTFDVLVVGAGPAGLAAATALSRRGRSTIVVEREAEAGGVPRHCAHSGFGWLDLRRVSSGPQYAR